MYDLLVDPKRKGLLYGKWDKIKNKTGQFLSHIYMLILSNGNIPISVLLSWAWNYIGDSMIFLCLWKSLMKLFFQIQYLSLTQVLSFLKSKTWIFLNICFLYEKMNLAICFSKSLNPIQDGSFRGCSQKGGRCKKPPSLKSVTHILLSWNLPQLYLM